MTDLRFNGISSCVTPCKVQRLWSLLNGKRWLLFYLGLGSWVRFDIAKKEERKYLEVDGITVHMSQRKLVVDGVKSIDGNMGNCELLKGIILEGRNRNVWDGVHKLACWVSELFFLCLLDESRALKNRWWVRSQQRSDGYKSRSRKSKISGTISLWIGHVFREPFFANFGIL